MRTCSWTAVTFGLLMLAGSSSTRAQTPGSQFRDCPDCPEMVVVPAGRFTMGSEVFDSEKPPHPVTIAKPFAVGKFEVTFSQWDACASDGHCKHSASDHGWGRGRRPVIDVTWADAQEFCAWLSRKTSKPYRLLTEAEWEYAARGGTSTAFATGDTITTDQANFDGNFTFGSEAKGIFRGKTVEVGTFKPNAFGLYDMHGNVGEFVQDCYKDNHTGAPRDGTAVPEAIACPRVLRGGTWNRDPRNVRSASRYRTWPGFRHETLGFRVARNVDP